MQFDEARGGYGGGYGGYVGYGGYDGYGGRRLTPRGGTPRMRKSWLCSIRWACRCTAAL